MLECMLVPFCRSLISILMDSRNSLLFFNPDGFQKVLFGSFLISTCSNAYYFRFGIGAAGKGVFTVESVTPWLITSLGPATNPALPDGDLVTASLNYGQRAEPEDRRQVPRRPRPLLVSFGVFERLSRL